MVGVIVFGIVMAFVAVVVYVTIRNCATGHIPLNRTVGNRVGAVLQDEASWERGHRAALLPLGVGIVGSVILVVAAIFLVAGPGPMAGDLGFTSFCWVLACLLWATFRAVRAAGRSIKPLAHG